jgi:putative MATE family efflux protein
MDDQTQDNSPDKPKSRFGRDLTTGSIPRHLVAFALPMLAGSALQTAYSFVNYIWVGQCLGPTSQAALMVSFPVVFVMIALGIGLTMATNILISQYWGARDMAAVRRVVHSSSVLIYALGVLFLVVGEVLAPAILRAMATPPEVLAAAIQYMRIVLLTLPLMFGLFLVRNMLQGIGDSTTPLYFQSGALLLNALLDPVLMFGWLGMPKLGLCGTAYASVIAQGLALVCLSVYLRKRNNPVAPAMGLSGFDWHTAWLTIQIGIPSAVQQALVAVGIVFVTGIVNGFGVTTMAAFGTASRVDQLAFMPAMTFSMAAATLAGQNIGAQRFGRIRQILFWGCLLSGGSTLLISLLVVSLPRLLLRIFTPDEAVIRLGIDYLRIVGGCYVFFAIMFISNGIINGSGHTLVTTVISVISLWVVRVPLAYWLSHRTGSVNSVGYAMALSFAVSMVASMAYYATGRWRRPVVKRRPSTAMPETVLVEETSEA